MSRKRLSMLLTIKPTPLLAQLRSGIPSLPVLDQAYCAEPPITLPACCARKLPNVRRVLG